MNEWIYILLGFFAGITFTILFAISSLKSMIVKIGNVPDNLDDK